MISGYAQFCCNCGFVFFMTGCPLQRYDFNFNVEMLWCVTVSHNRDLCPFNLYHNDVNDGNICLILVVFYENERDGISNLRKISNVDEF